VTSTRRLVARFIDLIVALFVLMPLSLALSYPAERILQSSNMEAGWIFVAFWAGAAVVYETVMQRLFGGTVGKMLLGMRVVDAKGEKLCWGRSLVRSVALWVSGIVVVFLVIATVSIFGWIFLIALPKYRRFPHDLAGKSFVVREVRGQLVKASAGTSTLWTAQKPTPLVDLERLRSQGIISKEEYDRKRKEIGL